jgi:hypothetical protein
VIPFIGGGEEKLESEPLKILGRLEGTAVVPALITISAHTNRVAVIDGHTEVVSLGFARRVTPAEAIAVMNAFVPPAEVRALPPTPGGSSRSTSTPTGRNRDSTSNVQGTRSPSGGVGPARCSICDSSCSVITRCAGRGPRCRTPNCWWREGGGLMRIALVGNGQMSRRCRRWRRPG